MDVLHHQVEEYESEIRFLKDTKSPNKSRSRTPRRTFGAEHLRETSRSGDALQSMSGEINSGAFEAALFRPALQAARRDAAHWKAKSTISTFLELPPLNVPVLKDGGEEKTADEDLSPLFQLSSALANYRQQTASMKVVDLTKPRAGPSPRAELYSMVKQKASAAHRLDEAAAFARQWMEQQRVPNMAPSTSVGGAPLVGRVRFAGAEPVKTFTTPTNVEDLHRLQLHMHMIQ